MPPGGYLIALRDTNSDGRADDIRRFGSTSESGSKGGTGIALNGNELYAEADSTIVRYRLSGSDPVPSGKPEVIVSALPTKGGHTMHPIAVDGQNLFVNVGSATNACQVKDRQAGSKGRDPCQELEKRAGIWRFSHQPGQRYGPSQRYATGIRNADGLALYSDGTLYSTQHGRDQLGENWPKLLQLEAERQPAGRRAASDPAGRRLRLALLLLRPGGQASGAGAGVRRRRKEVGRCAEKLGPVAAFPAHWAPNALTFYHGTMFPQEYRGGAFIAFHGSWNRAPEPQEGYNVVFQPMANGKASGSYQVFADGFAGARKDPGMAAHRPAGLAVGPTERCTSRTTSGERSGG